MAMQRAFTYISYEKCEKGTKMHLIELLFAYNFDTKFSLYLFFCHSTGRQRNWCANQNVIRANELEMQPWPGLFHMSSAQN